MNDYEWLISKMWKECLCLFKILSQILPGIIQYLICYVLLRVVLCRRVCCYSVIFMCTTNQTYKRVTFYWNHGYRKMWILERQFPAVLVLGMLQIRAGLNLWDIGLWVWRAPLRIEQRLTHITPRQWPPSRQRSVCLGLWKGFRCWR
jgi:hypothetical protein